MILGVVLAGGRSSRFGSDKAQALFGGQPLAAHAKALLDGHCDHVLIVGGPHGDIADMPRPHLGPLGGIAAGLDHAATHGFDTILTIACDMPRVPPGLIRSLLDHAPSYCIDAPVLGHWPSALGAHLLAHLEASPDRAIHRWARAVGALPVMASGPVANVNRPEDLAAL